MNGLRTILEEWHITVEELSKAIRENPSLRGMVFGYVAEVKLKEVIRALPDVTYFTKYDDHNRKKKGDLYIVYRDRAFNIESKSLQTNQQAWDEAAGKFVGVTQVDGSDKRTVTFADGTQLTTTNLLRGEFDILAVNCYAFEKTWRWVYTRNVSLQSSRYRRYTEAQRSQLLNTSQLVTWPPESPYTANLCGLLDDMVLRGEGSTPETALVGGEIVTEGDEERGASALPPLATLLDEDQEV